VCDYVFLGVPAKHLELLELIVVAEGPRGLKIPLRPDVPPPVLAVFPKGYFVAFAALGGCSCGLYYAGPRVENDERARAKYAKKGWSQAKIDRALASRGGVSGPPRGYDRFCDSLAEIVRAGGRLALLTYSGSGLFDDPPFEPRGKLELTIDQFLERQGACPLQTLVLLSTARP
jgi:hypothetical protein